MSTARKLRQCLERYGFDDCHGVYHDLCGQTAGELSRRPAACRASPLDAHGDRFLEDHCRRNPFDAACLSERVCPPYKSDRRPWCDENYRQACARFWRSVSVGLKSEATHPREAEICACAKPFTQEEKAGFTKVSGLPVMQLRRECHDPACNQGSYRFDPDRPCPATGCVRTVLAQGQFVKLKLPGCQQDEPDPEQGGGVPLDKSRYYRSLLDKCDAEFALGEARGRACRAALGRELEDACRALPGHPQCAIGGTMPRMSSFISASLIATVVGTSLYFVTVSQMDRGTRMVVLLLMLAGLGLWWWWPAMEEDPEQSDADDDDEDSESDVFEAPMEGYDIPGHDLMCKEITDDYTEEDSRAECAANEKCTGYNVYQSGAAKMTCHKSNTALETQAVPTNLGIEWHAKKGKW